MKGILIVNKPADWTSHDVVAKLRRILGERRVGHGGTLDPMATGVLPVFVGRATRAAEFLEQADKEYVAGLRLGVTTDTQDTTGSVLRARAVFAARADLERVLRDFTGEIRQLPPMYSAVKVGGKKLYEYARAGKSAARKTRSVTLHALELLGGGGADYSFRAVCSKGTYIRTLCHDVGEALGCGGALSALVRTRAGAYTLGDAHTLEEIGEAAARGEAARLLLGIDSLFPAQAPLTVGAAEEQKLRNGAAFPCAAPPARYRLYAESGEFLALGEVSEGFLHTVKSFYDV